MDIASIKAEVSSTSNYWADGGDLMLNIDSVICTMLSEWKHPTEESLEGITWQQWQFERDKRIALAVIDWIEAKQKK